MRTLILLVLAASLSGCRVHHSSEGVSSFSNSDWDSVSQETLSYAVPINAGGKLVAEVPYGAMNVRVVPGCTPTLTVRVQIRGKTAEDVENAKQGFEVTVEQAGDTVRVNTVSTGVKSGRASLQADMDFDLPADCALELKSGSGGIRAEPGPFGPSRLESKYGPVNATGVHGGLVAKSGSGSVGAAQLRDGRIELTSSYGAIDLRDAVGETIDLKTGSGSIEAEKLKATRITMDSKYGPVSVRNIDGAIEASSGSGKVTGTELTGPTIQLTSRYGPIDVRRASGTLELKTGSGDVIAREVEGSLSAVTTYGTVEIDGVFTVLSGESGSGSVNALARHGSRVESAWKLTSRYGSVELQGPPDLAFELAARTSYGTIQLGYTLQLAPGELGQKKQVAGTVNGGGPRVTLDSKNGSLRIAPLPEAAVPAGSTRKP